LKQSNLSSSSSNNNAGSYNRRPPYMRWVIRGSRSSNTSKSGSANETSRETEKIFSPSMLDTIVVGVRQWCVRWNFLAISNIFRTVYEVSVGISVELELKPPSTKPMVLPMSMFGFGSGNTNTSGGASTSTSAPPPPPPPQPHIGDNDKLADASALDIFNAADTLAGEMSLHRALLQISTKEVMVMVGWQRCRYLLLSLELAEALAQVRQKVPHKRTFLYLEQLILKHDAQKTRSR